MENLKNIKLFWDSFTEGYIEAFNEHMKSPEPLPGESPYDTFKRECEIIRLAQEKEYRDSWKRGFREVFAFFMLILGLASFLPAFMPSLFGLH